MSIIELEYSDVFYCSALVTIIQYSKPDHSIPDEGQYCVLFISIYWYYSIIPSIVKLFFYSEEELFVPLLNIIQRLLTNSMKSNIIIIIVFIWNDIILMSLFINILTIYFSICLLQWYIILTIHCLLFNDILRYCVYSCVIVLTCVIVIFKYDIYYYGGNCQYSVVSILILLLSLIFILIRYLWLLFRIRPKASILQYIVLFCCVALIPLLFDYYLFETYCILQSILLFYWYCAYCVVVVREMTFSIRIEGGNLVMSKPVIFRLNWSIPYVDMWLFEIIIVAWYWPWWYSDIYYYSVIDIIDIYSMSEIIIIIMCIVQYSILPLIFSIVCQKCIQYCWGYSMCRYIRLLLLFEEWPMCVLCDILFIVSSIIIRYILFYSTIPTLMCPIVWPVVLLLTYSILFIIEEYCIICVIFIILFDDLDYSMILKYWPVFGLLFVLMILSYSYYSYWRILTWNIPILLFYSDIY